MLDHALSGGTFIGRAWLADIDGPAVVTVRGDRLVDITSRAAPTVRDVCEMAEPAEFVRTAEGRDICALADLASGGDVTLLAPCDLQAIKACGVTFAESMVERVIEERAAGDPAPMPRCSPRPSRCRRSAPAP